MGASVEGGVEQQQQQEEGEAASRPASISGRRRRRRQHADREEGGWMRRAREAEGARPPRQRWSSSCSSRSLARCPSLVGAALRLRSAPPPSFCLSARSAAPPHHSPPCRCSLPHTSRGHGGAGDVAVGPVRGAGRQRLPVRPGRDRQQGAHHGHDLRATGTFHQHTQRDRQRRLSMARMCCYERLATQLSSSQVSVLFVDLVSVCWWVRSCATLAGWT